MASSGSASRCNQLSRLLKEARAEKKAAIRDLEEKYHALQALDKRVDKLSRDYALELENLVSEQGLYSISRKPIAVEEAEKFPNLSTSGAGASMSQEGESSSTGQNRQRSSAIQRIDAALSTSDDRARGRPPPSSTERTTSQGSSTPTNGPDNPGLPGRIVNPTREELMRYYQSSSPSLAGTSTSSDSPSLTTLEIQSRPGDGSSSSSATPTAAKSPEDLIPLIGLKKPYGKYRPIDATDNTASSRNHQGMNLRDVEPRSHDRGPGASTDIPRPLEIEDDRKRGPSSSDEDHRAKLQKRGPHSH
ncbi:MAG: hypothetical protein Q9174_005450 [Haloplaca sp. 1 TL-2023]